MFETYKPQDRALHSSPASKLRSLLSTNKRLIVPVVYCGLTARLVKLAGFEVSKNERLCSTHHRVVIAMSLWWCVIRFTRSGWFMPPVGLGSCHLL